MTQIIVDPTRDPQEAPLVTEENQQDYQAARPVNELFETALIGAFACSDALRQKRLVMDMGLDDEQGRARMDIGQFEAEVDRFKITVNWSTAFAGKIPPGHILVEYGGAEVGMLSPYSDGLPVHGVPPMNYWSGIFVMPADLWQACAAAAAKTSKKDYMWQAMEGDQVDDFKAGRDIDNTPLEED